MGDAPFHISAIRTWWLANACGSNRGNRQPRGRLDPRVDLSSPHSTWLCRPRSTVRRRRSFARLERNAVRCRNRSGKTS